jgi:uncharacterized FlaG/YvyC family protein
MNNIAGSINSINFQRLETFNITAAPFAAVARSGSINTEKANTGAVVVADEMVSGSAVSASISPSRNTTADVNAVTKGAKAAPVADLDKNLQAVLKAEAKESLNPSFALSTLTLFKWDPKAGGTVIDIVNSKTGKVESQIPSKEFIKYMMSHEQKGTLLNEKL